MLTKTTTLIGTGSKFEILRQTCQKRLSGPIRGPIIPMSREL